MFDSEFDSGADPAFDAFDSWLINLDRYSRDRIDEIPSNFRSIINQYLTRIDPGPGEGGRSAPNRGGGGEVGVPPGPPPPPPSYLWEDGTIEVRLVPGRRRSPRRLADLMREQLLVFYQGVKKHGIYRRRRGIASGATARCVTLMGGRRQSIPPGGGPYNVVRKFTLGDSEVSWAPWAFG